MERDEVRVPGRGSPGGGGEEAGEPQHRLVASVVAAADGRGGSGASAGEWGSSRLGLVAAVGQGAVCLGDRVGRLYGPTLRKWAAEHTQKPKT